VHSSGQDSCHFVLFWFIFAWKKRVWPGGPGEKEGWIGMVGRRLQDHGRLHSFPQTQLEPWQPFPGLLLTHAHRGSQCLLISASEAVEDYTCEPPGLGPNAYYFIFRTEITLKYVFRVSRLHYFVSTPSFAVWHITAYLQNQKRNQNLHIRGRHDGA
jgi:hypothetical protein